MGVPRDRVLFETGYVSGARTSEVRAMYVEDLDLRPDYEHARCSSGYEMDATAGSRWKCAVIQQ